MTAPPQPQNPLAPRVRLIAAAGGSIIPLVALLIARLLWGSELPETVATHWSGTQPDGFTSGTTFFTITFAACALSAAVAGWVTVQALRGKNLDAPLWLPGTAVLSWALASACIVSVMLTQQAGAPELARLGWWIAIPLFAVPWGYAVFAITPRTPAATVDVTSTLDTPLTLSERAVWVSYARGRWAAVLTIAMATTALVTALLGAAWMAVLFIVLAIVAAAFASIAVHVDRRGISVASWGVRWRTIALDDIAGASVIDIRPVEWGGYGYRMGRRGTAVVVRRGAALAVQRRTNTLFAVTVDNPETGAALINSLVQARENSA